MLGAILWLCRRGEGKPPRACRLTHSEGARPTPQKGYPTASAAMAEYYGGLKQVMPIVYQLAAERQTIGQHMAGRT